MLILGHVEVDQMDDSGLCATTSFVQSWKNVFGQSFVFSYICSTALVVSSNQGK